MKTWSIIFAIIAIVALIATIAGRNQIFPFAIAGIFSYTCWYADYEIKRKTRNQQ